MYPNNLKPRLKAGEVVLGTALDGRDIYVAAATFASLREGASGQAAGAD